MDRKAPTEDTRQPKMMDYRLRNKVWRLAEKVKKIRKERAEIGKCKIDLEYKIAELGEIVGRCMCRRGSSGFTVESV